MQTLVLSRRNLLTLLNKLDRTKAGDASACTIIKQDTIHPRFPCSDIFVVRAVEDEEYYIDRAPDDVVHRDDPNVTQIRR